MEQKLTTPHTSDKKSTRRILIGFIISTAGFVGIIVGICTFGILFEMKYKEKVYPAVTIGNIPFGGQTKEEVKAFWEKKNEPFQQVMFYFQYNTNVASISAEDLLPGYDAELLSTQAYLLGRSTHIPSNITLRYLSKTVNLSPLFRWNTDKLDQLLDDAGETITSPPENALFEFANKRVSAFRASKDGTRINKQKTIQAFELALRSLEKEATNAVSIPITVDTIKPTETTESVNTFGIKERIGRGYSAFTGSIPGRIHNVALAASRINGVLIKPGETFSFNTIVGDISAATGYQSAYIIKDGRTVLGDGGGVCQVSSTLFRAALDAGLPIIERHAHAYRVHYYEDGGFKAGLDATVFSPSVDLKFKNNTPAYILIQSKTDTNNLNLTFELYGTSDGRKSEIINHVVYGETPPPPPLYQDDPTLPNGVITQVDFSAWGAKASFEYKVTRNGQSLEDETFVSVFRPWQAVFLKGTK
jgi:vancomycin resistance protein YoaR